MSVGALLLLLIYQVLFLKFYHLLTKTLPMLYAHRDAICLFNSSNSFGEGDQYSFDRSKGNPSSGGGPVVTGNDTESTYNGAGFRVALDERLRLFEFSRAFISVLTERVGGATGLFILAETASDSSAEFEVSA